MIKKSSFKPLILAPAGTRASFLAALAAGADVIYCGLKNFSARMEAKNFSIYELAQLAILARKHGVRIYIAMNAMLKPDEIQIAGETIDSVKRYIKPDAIIIQDLGFIPLIQQVGFNGEIHLSTLANVSFPKALQFIDEALNIHHAVIPRELSIDEIKAMANASPEGFKLETFVHGALCYGVSGRCYWSSYMGGKSSLRGRCVQPCRRRYLQNGFSERNFSCCDLSLDVLSKVLNGVSKVNSWKIEGRKKGPHYVFYTISAYKMFRDHGKDPKKKKAALGLLNNCLGRQGTHYNFLSQRPQNPVEIGKHTSSGLLIGRIKGGKKPFFISREELLSDDVLRIGYEDEPWHSIIRVTHYVPKKGKLYIKLKNTRIPSIGTPVFLKNRLENTLCEMMQDIENTHNFNARRQHSHSKFIYSSEKTYSRKQKILDINVRRKLEKLSPNEECGFWLSETFLNSIKKSRSHFLWVWLPPVVWPNFECDFSKLITRALDKGVRNFVLNMPWQMIFFKRYKSLNLWAGPFCNISNVMSLNVFKKIGFHGAIISPELSFDDYVKLAQESSIPVGIVISGNWPLCISRFVSSELKLNCLFKSPKGEGGWVTQHESNYWVFPDWQLDITKKRSALLNAGYSMFINIIESVPGKLKLKKRPGLWNLKIGLK